MGAVLEAQVLPLGLERIRIGPCEDGAREVLVGVSVARHGASEPRQHLREVPAVERAEEARARCGELEDDDAPTRANDPRHLDERARAIGRVADPEGHGRTVRAGRGERERERVPVDEARPAEPLATRLARGSRHHLVGEVHPNHLSASAGREEGEVPGPGAHVHEGQMVEWPTSGHGLEGSSAPALVHAHREPPVEEVVGPRDAREHGADGLGIRHGGERIGRAPEPWNGRRPPRVRARASCSLQGPRRGLRVTDASSRRPPRRSGPGRPGLPPRTGWCRSGARQPRPSRGRSRCRSRRRRWAPRRRRSAPR